MSTHAYIGYTILAGKKTMEMAAEIAWSHHERWDGTGYPRGLSGEAIPLAARIVALIDVYDALRSHRPYKEPWSHERSLEYILGSEFSPEAMSAFGICSTRIAERNGSSARILGAKLVFRSKPSDCRSRKRELIISPVGYTTVA
jgi:putative two-component system response regulator